MSTQSENQHFSVSVNDLFVAKKGKTLSDLVDEVELVFDDKIVWVLEKPTTKIVITGQKVDVKLWYRVSTTKAFITLSTVCGTIWALVKFLVPLLPKLYTP